MGVRIFLTTNSGNKEIENGQQKIMQVLKTRGIEYETIDISAPGMQDLRKFMREKGKKKDGQRNVLPPQIFNGEECRGNFEDFDIANEDDLLEEFLGIPRKNPKAAPVKTGAVAPEVGRLNPGKLDIKEKHSDNSGVVQKNKDSCDNETENEDKIDDKNNASSLKSQECETAIDNVIDNESLVSDSCNDANDADTDSGFRDETDTLETKSDTDSDDFQQLENLDKLDNETEGQESQSDSFLKKSEDDIKDNLASLGIDVDEGLSLVTGGDDSDSSDFDSDSEDDNVVEFMPDGEIVRKKSRGFKQLNNCKRFWKASLMLEKV